MPIYEYQRIDSDGTIERWEAIRSMSDRDDPIDAPSGKGKGTRVISNFGAIHFGLTATEKAVGTTPHRKEWGKYMKDNREKRKKNYSPTTREGMSNELWVGNEVKDGVIAAPNEKQMAGMRPQATPTELVAKSNAAKEAAANWGRKTDSTLNY